MSKPCIQAFRKYFIRVSPQLKEHILSMTDFQVYEQARQRGLVKQINLKTEKSPKNAQNDDNSVPNTVEATKNNPKRINQAGLKLNQNQRQSFIKTIASIYPDMQAGVRKLDDCDIKECYDEIMQRVQRNNKQVQKKNILIKNGRLNTALMKELLVQRMPHQKARIMNLSDSQIEGLHNQVVLQGQQSKEKGQGQGAPKAARKKRRYWGRLKRGHKSRAPSGFTHVNNSSYNSNTYNDRDNDTDNYTDNNPNQTILIPNIDDNNNPNNTILIPNIDDDNDVHPYKSYKMVDNMGHGCIVQRFGDKLINLSQYPYSKVNLEREKQQLEAYKVKRGRPKNSTKTARSNTSQFQSQSQQQGKRSRRALSLPLPPPSFDYSGIMKYNNLGIPIEENSNDEYNEEKGYRVNASKEQQKHQRESLYNDNLVRMMRPMQFKPVSYQSYSNQFYSSQINNLKKRSNQYAENNRKQLSKGQAQRKNLNQRRSTDGARQDTQRREQAATTKDRNQVKGQSQSGSGELFGRINQKLEKVFRFKSWQRSQSSDECSPKE